MTSDMIQWMARQLSNNINGATRRKMLRDLKHNPEVPLEAFSCLLGRLTSDYILETHAAVPLDLGNTDEKKACAEEIVNYMRDELFADEIAAME